MALKPDKTPMRIDSDEGEESSPGPTSLLHPCLQCMELSYFPQWREVSIDLVYEFVTRSGTVMFEQRHDQRRSGSKGRLAVPRSLVWRMLVVVAVCSCACLLTKRAQDCRPSRPFSTTASQLVSGASLELSPASRPFSCLAAGATVNKRTAHHHRSDFSLDPMDTPSPWQSPRTTTSAC